MKINQTLLKNVLMSSLILGAVPTFATVYEDAEDNATTNWVIYAGGEDATVTNVWDTDKLSRVIELNGNGRETGYRLGNRTGSLGYVGPWDNHLGIDVGKKITWSMKYDEDFRIYIELMTQNGNRYLTYTNQPTDEKGKVRGGKITHGLGEDSADGTWHTFTRDLEADWNEFDDSNNSIISVNGFFIRGSGRVDDIILEPLDVNPGDGDNNATNPGDGDNNATNPGDGDNNATNPGDGDNNATNPGDGDNNTTTPADTEAPVAKLAVPKFANGDTIPGLNNRIQGANIGRQIKLNASESTDNVGVVTYTFKKNISGKNGVENFIDIDGCVNIATAECLLIPDTNTKYGTKNWARTYYRVEAKDAAGNTDISGYRFVEVKK